MIEYTVKVYPNGDKSWWLNDKLHREDGPAMRMLMAISFGLER